MPMLSATIPTGPTTVAAEKDLMATAGTALVTATFMSVFFVLISSLDLVKTSRLTKVALSPLLDLTYVSSHNL